MRNRIDGWIWRSGRESGGTQRAWRVSELSLQEVFEIAGAIPVRYRALVLLATFAGLRWGELIALRRHNIDLAACDIRIVETTAQLDTGRLRAETPKSRAGRRTVAFSAELLPEIRWHLERFAEPGERGLVFVGPKGARLRRSTFGRIWVQAYARAGTPASTSTISGAPAAPSPPPLAPASRN